MAKDGSPGRRQRPGARVRQLSRHVPMLGWASILVLWLLAMGGTASGAAVAALAALLLALVLVWVWLRVDALVGPLFFLELVRLARRGRLTLLRFSYGLILLVLLTCLYLQRFPNRDLVQDAFRPDWYVPIREVAGFGQQFVMAFMVVQSIAIYVFTPLYLGGAVAEEKERRTLDLLLTTQLGDHEIILGKLLARLSVLLLLLLMGTPILCLTGLLGGVSYLLLFAGFAATVVNLVTVGCVSICISVLARTSLQAILGIYGIMLAFACGIVLQGSPASLVVTLEHLLEVGSGANEVEVTFTTVGVYTAIQGLIALFFLSGALANLRQGNDTHPLLESVPRQTGKPPEVPQSPRPAAQVPAAQGPWMASYLLTFAEVLEKEPLLWKEAYRSPSDLGSYLGMVLLSFILYLTFLFLGALAAAPDIELSWLHLLQLVVRLTNSLLLSLWIVLTAFRSVGSLSRERQQGTLESLFLLPLSREAILRAFRVGSIVRYRGLGYCGAACLLIGLVTGALHPLAMLLVVLSAWTCLTLVASIGVWLALTCRTAAWAYASMGLVLLLFFAGSAIAAFNGFGAPASEKNFLSWQSSLAQVGLNPLLSWWLAAFCWNDLAEACREQNSLVFARLGGIHLGLAVFLAASFLFRWSSSLRIQHSLRS